MKTSRSHFTPTPEQAEGVAISTKLGPGELLLYNAYAGSGKTSTLELISDAVSRDWRVLYICYNADMAREAAGRLPKNVTSKTAHSLAYGAMIPKNPTWKTRLGNLRARDLQTLLRISSSDEAQAVVDVFNYFLCLPLDSGSVASPVDAFTSQLVIDAGWGMLAPLEKASVIRGCIALYRSIFEGVGPAVAVPHDAYLWAYIYSAPVVPFDLVLVDESQDLNPLLLRFVELQLAAGKRVVMVGDRHQAIYAFRRATNALEKMADRANYSLTLTQSFRFPQLVANQASRLLNDFKGDPVKLIGRGKGTKSPSETTTTCFIARTNAALVDKAASLLNQRRTRFHFAATREQDGFKPTGPYKFSEIRDVYSLWTGRSGNVRTPWLRQFASYGALLAYANPPESENGKGGDAELKSMTALIDRYSTAVPLILSEIEAACTGPDEATIALSSAHRSKGKEWDFTQLSDDFLPLDNSEKLAKFRSSVTPAEFSESVNLLYVAATRCRLRSTLPGNCQNYFNPPAGNVPSALASGRR